MHFQKDDDNNNINNVSNGIQKVSVMTGVTTGELTEFQLRHGVNLPCNVVLRDVTVGGIVSCMSHVRFTPWRICR